MKELEKQVAALFSSMQDGIIRRSAARIARMDFTVSETTMYEVERALAAGAVYDDVVSSIAQVLKVSESQIRQAFDESDWGEFLEEEGAPAFMQFGRGALSWGMLQLVKINSDKLNLHIKNLTGTTANRVQEDFINACDAAYADVASGTSDVHSAVTRAVREMAIAGVRVQYPSGHVDTVDVAARRAVRTSVSQTRGEIVGQWCRENSHDLVDVSAHAGARPEHTLWQGGRYSLSGENKDYPDFESSTGYGTPTGLKGYNCRHEYFPAYEFMPPAYSDEELAELANQTVTYNDEEIPLSKARQIQRKYERSIRATKRELVGLDELRRVQPKNSDAALAFDRQSLKLKRQCEKLTDFLGQTGMKRVNALEQVAGFDRSVSSAAVHGAKRELTREREAAIIKEIKAIKGFGSAEIHLKPKYIDVSELGFDLGHVAGRHAVTEAEAKMFINEAKISVTKWKGMFENYYGENGTVYVNVAEKYIRTAYKKEEYNDDIKDLIKVLRKYGI